QLMILPVFDHLSEKISFTCIPLIVISLARRLDLPSFPTRRSSDLGHRPLALPARGPVRRAGEGARGAERAPQALPTPARDRGQRSEEHTSELQSPYELVCRLLLEKKKRRNGGFAVNCRHATACCGS